MPEKPAVNVLVEDKFTKAVLGSYSLHEPLRLRFSGAKRNVVNELEHIEASLGNRIHPLVLDLYNIALVIYVWDLNTLRSGIGPRDFRALIAVSNKDRWLSVKNHLEATLRFLTGDNFTFHFVQGKEGKRDIKFEKRDQSKVSLLSGGLDSLAGVKWLINERKRPLLVSHEPKGLVTGVQEELVTDLRKIVGELKWYQIRAAGEPGSGLDEKEFTQFSRSFLYLTIGTIFAIQLGMDSIYIFENGVVAINIPLTQSRIYNNTRTAHPFFLFNYERLLADLFGPGMAIINPFLNKTKGEVVQLLDTDKFRKLIATTVSCPNLTRMRWKGVKLKQIRNCGICFPCIVRRIAIHHANLWDHDGKYNENAFAEWLRIPEEARRLLLEMADFGRRIDSFQTVDDAFAEFPQFYSHESIDPTPLFEMTKRQAEQMRNCFSAVGNQSLRTSLGLP